MYGNRKFWNTKTYFEHSYIIYVDFHNHWSSFSYFSLKKYDYVPYVMFIDKCFTLSKYIVTRFDWKGFSMCLDGN